MSEQTQEPTEAQKQTMLFAQLVEILTQNAVMMLGVMPDRSGRQRPPDLNGAEMMIDMLSLVQKKTKGNLTKDEEKMLSGTLFQLQSAFAEVASKSGEFGKARKAKEAADASDDETFSEAEEVPEPPPQQQQRPAPTPTQPAPAQKAAKGIHPSSHEPAESKVKFTKKYS